MAWTFSDALGSLKTLGEASLSAYSSYQNTRLQSELTRAQIEAVQSETAAIRNLGATTTAGTQAATPTPAPAPAAPLVITSGAEEAPELRTAVGDLIQNQAAIAAQLQSVGAARTVNADRARVARLTGQAKEDDAQRMMLLAAAGLGLVLIAIQR